MSAATLAPAPAKNRLQPSAPARSACYGAVGRQHEAPDLKLTRRLQVIQPTNSLSAQPPAGETARPPHRGAVAYRHQSRCRNRSRSAVDSAVAQITPSNASPARVGQVRRGWALEEKSKAWVTAAHLWI